MIVDERVVVSEYSESLLLKLSGTVNVYSVGAIVTVVAETVSPTVEAVETMIVVVIPSKVTFVLIPSVIISVSKAATSTMVLILSVSSR